MNCMARRRRAPDQNEFFKGSKERNLFIARPVPWICPLPARLNRSGFFLLCSNLFVLCLIKGASAMDAINLDILGFIRENPGTSRASILEAFHISEYRLNRALRGLKREYPDMAFPWSHEHGMWLVQHGSTPSDGSGWSNLIPE